MRNAWRAPRDLLLALLLARLLRLRLPLTTWVRTVTREVPLFIIVKTEAATPLFLSFRLSTTRGQGGRLIHYVAGDHGGLDLGLGLVVSLALVLILILILVPPLLLTYAVG